jgi:Na+/melibiose symporter-like transporter
MYLIAVICGLSVSVSFLLPWSMIPDVIDEFMIKTGERKEPIFYSFFVFFTKFASGIAVAISQLVLELVNYKDCPNGCCPEPQPEAVGFSLRLLVVPLPVVMLIISLVLLWFHPINEKRRLEIKEKLIEIRSTNSQLSDKSQSQSEQSDNVNQISI